METTPLAAIGPLVRDIVYVRDEAGKYFLVGSRGGGALWNAIANASVNRVRSFALCVGGLDDAASTCVDDLRKAGVQVLLQNMVRGKRTRTLHEVLSLRSVKLMKPKHRFDVRCPVCNTETYRRGTASAGKQFALSSTRVLRKEFPNGLLIHTDGLDSTRISALKSLREHGGVVSLDLGRSTGLFRMHQTAPLERLKAIDIVFAHSKVLPELKRMAGAASEAEVLEKTGVRLLISTRGEKGVSAWLRTDGEVQHFDQPSSRPKPLVDTAGAGDALIGYFLAQLAQRTSTEIRDVVNDQKTVEEILQDSQRWAAFKCGFVGARGHFAGPDGSTWSWDLTTSKLPTAGSIEDLKLANLARSRCTVCDSSIFDPLQASIDTLRFRQNVLTLPAKVEKAWSDRKSTPWPELLNVRGPGYAVGTGGSFVVANFVALVLSQVTHTPITPVRPFDFIRTGLPVPLAIFVSNAGKTPDTVRALERARQLEVSHIVFLTGARIEYSDLPLRRDVDLLLNTGADGERGFLSVAGVVVPCLMLWAAVTPELWSDENGYLSFHRLYETARERAQSQFAQFDTQIRTGFQGKRIVILGGGFAWPAMLDLESKMVESGMGHPEVSEIKDYSHGRFVSSIDQRVVAIVFGMPDDEPFRSFLVKRLKSSNYVVELVTNHYGVEGAIELILQAEQLMRLVAEKAGVDISKPKIPPAGLELYYYADILGFNQPQDQGETQK